MNRLTVLALVLITVSHGLGRDAPVTGDSPVGEIPEPVQVQFTIERSAATRMPPFPKILIIQRIGLKGVETE